MNRHPSESEYSPTDNSLEIGARITKPPSPLLVATAFTDELHHQTALAEAIGLADMAHTVMCMDTGIIPPAEGKDLLKALLDLHNHPNRLSLAAKHGDLYTNREVFLKQKTNAVNWLGVGRARREATTTAFLITVRNQLLLLQNEQLDYIQTIADKAWLYRDALMPDYTYLQPAEATHFGHYILGFGFAVKRDLERLQCLFERVNLSPAGCGSTNGSRLPQDRQQLAKLLGFDGLVIHARDAMWQADLPIEIVSLISSIMINLDRCAEDLHIFSTQAFGLIELDDGHTRASKILPQKKNPFALTHIRAICNEFIGLSASTLAYGRTPSGQPDNRLSIYGTLPMAIEKTIGALALMNETLSLCRFHSDIGQKRLQESDSQATGLAEALTLSQMDPRSAHRLVGTVVRQLNERQSHLANLQLTELKEIAMQYGVELKLSENELAMALSTESSLQEKLSIGGCSDSSMQSMCETLSDCVRTSQAWINVKQAALSNSEAVLLQNVRALIQP